MARRATPLILAAFFLLVGVASAFVPAGKSATVATSTAPTFARASKSPSNLSALPSADLLLLETTASSVSLPSTVTSAVTIDPTAIISGLVGGLINTPAILFVPIGAGVLVASLVAWFIISYANPADEDD